jgi:hypothetical protein
METRLAEDFRKEEVRNLVIASTYLSTIVAGPFD